MLRTNRQTETNGGEHYSTHATYTLNTSVEHDAVLRWSVGSRLQARRAATENARKSSVRAGGVTWSRGHVVGDQGQDTLYASASTLWSHVNV